MAPKTGCVPPHGGATRRDAARRARGDPYRWMEELDAPRRALDPGREPADRVWLPGAERAPSASACRSSGTTSARVPGATAALLLHPQRRPPEPVGLYVADSLEGAARCCRPPNAARRRHRGAGRYATSDDGRHWLPACPRPARLEHWKVRDVATGRTCPTSLRWVKFRAPPGRATARASTTSATTSPGRQGAAAENRFPRVHYHALGRPVAARWSTRGRTADWYFGSHGQRRRPLLVLQVELGSSVNNGIFYRDLAAPTRRGRSCWRLRRALPCCRQRRAGLLRQDQPGRRAPGGGHRHAPAGARRLARAGPAGGRDPGQPEPGGDSPREY